MNAATAIDKCLSFINVQLNPSEHPSGGAQAPSRLAVTLSRQTGSGAWLVAERLADYLQQHAPPGPGPWTVFDKQLVEKVLEDHNLPKKLARYMPEDRVSAIDTIMREILGLHPPSWTLLHQTAETILKLAELGNVILIGRGANVITARLNHVFHVRLIGSLEKRLERVQKHLGFDQRCAMEYIVKSDRGRQRYLKEHFKVDIDNSLLYDMVINTDRISCDNAAFLIGHAVLDRAFLASSTGAV